MEYWSDGKKPLSEWTVPEIIVQSCMDFNIFSQKQRSTLQYSNTPE
jgi:hypothetical protein